MLKLFSPKKGEHESGNILFLWLSYESRQFGNKMLCITYTKPDPKPWKQVFEATMPFSGYNIVIICLKWNNSCWCFTASSVDFSWKRQWIISTFLEFCRNGGRSMFSQWACVAQISFAVYSDLPYQDCLWYTRTSGVCLYERLSSVLTFTFHVWKRAAQTFLKTSPFVF